MHAVGDPGRERDARGLAARHHLDALVADVAADLLHPQPDDLGAGAWEEDDLAAVDVDRRLPARGQRVGLLGPEVDRPDLQQQPRRGERRVPVPVGAGDGCGRVGRAHRSAHAGGPFMGASAISTILALDDNPRRPGIDGYEAAGAAGRAGLGAGGQGGDGVRAGGRDRRPARHAVPPHRQRRPVRPGPRRQPATADRLGRRAVGGARAAAARAPRLPRGALRRAPGRCCCRPSRWRATRSTSWCFPPATATPRPPVGGGTGRRGRRRTADAGAGGRPHVVSPGLLARARDLWADRLSHLPHPRLVVVLGGGQSDPAVAQTQVQALARRLAQIAQARRGCVLAAALAECPPRPRGRVFPPACPGCMHLIHRSGEARRRPAARLPRQCRCGGRRLDRRAGAGRGLRRLGADLRGADAGRAAASPGIAGCRRGWPGSTRCVRWRRGCRPGAAPRSTRPAGSPPPSSPDSPGSAIAPNDTSAGAGRFSLKRAAEPVHKGGLGLRGVRNSAVEEGSGQ